MATVPILRPVRWPDDEAALGTIDNSFSTTRIYRVRRGALAFHLEVETVDPPFRKSSGSVLDDLDRVRHMGHVVVADLAGVLIGVVAADLSVWNRRVQIERFYVAPDARRHGVGRALVDTVVAYARAVESWCVWLETQNTSYPAIQFYQRYGFRLCGLDQRLYDPAWASQSIEETALYFALDLVARDVGL